MEGKYFRGRGASTVAMPARDLLKNLEIDFRKLEHVETLYGLGLNPKAISEVMGENRSFAATRLDGMGVDRQQRVGLTELELRAIAALKEKKFHVTEISRILGRHTSLVHKALRGMNHPPRYNPLRDKSGRYLTIVTPELDNDIKELYVEHGIGLEPIGRRLGISSAFARERLVEMGVEIRPRGAGNGDNHLRLSHATMTLTIGLYRKGYSMMQIAQTLGVSTSTVQYRLSRAGVERRPRGVAQRLRKQMPEHVTLARAA